MNPRLYIGNLSPTVTEDELRLLFSRAGTVTGIEFLRDRDTGQPRGFAFVTMATAEAAAAALNSFHCYSLGGRHITVTEARPPQEPKGMMSEGFGEKASGSFRPEPQQRHSGRHRPRGSSNPKEWRG